MSHELTLFDSSRVRYTIGLLMYFAQGIPHGLLLIALPAWLVTEGLDAAGVSTYLAVLMLPWAFKLVTGPLMDRFEFLPMGSRRPWVIAAQAGLGLSLLALTRVHDPVAQLGLLSAIGFLVSAFAATQDVAVDGMAIDVTPVREQGRLNGFMSFGKAVGWSVTAAVSGVLLSTWGLGPTAVLAAAVSALPLLAILLVRERDGERLLPWSKGKAAAVERASVSFKTVLRDVNKVLWSGPSVAVIMIMFFDGLTHGYGQALMPIAAVQLFGYTTAEWSQLVALMGLIGAVLALGLGPVIDRAGPRITLIGVSLLLALHAATLAQTQHLWENSTYVRTMLSLYVLLNPMIMVSSLALAMAICNSPVSATQFAIYMSVANLGITVGSKVYGYVSEAASYVQAFTLLGILVAVFIFVLFMYRQRPVEPVAPNGVRRVPRFTVGATGGGGAVAFWSGAMRCPKCRVDMQQVDYEGTEVDRCVICEGLWFDAGELQTLSTKAAAAALDTGNAELGRRNDTLRHYQCPRCNGDMQRRVDARQAHIGFEVCEDCHGSFLDAGELRDLSTITVGEFFRSLMPRKPAG